MLVKIMKKPTVSFLLIPLCLFFPLVVYSENSSGWFWQNPLPTGGDIHDVWVFDENRACLAVQSGLMMQTYDGGETWEYSNLEIQGERIDSIYSLQFVNEDTGFVVCNVEVLGSNMIFASHLFKTDDGGDNWELVEIPVDYFNSFVMADDSTGWLTQRPIVSDSKIYKTMDCAETWELQCSADIWVDKIFAIDALHVWGCSYYASNDRNKNLIKSSDGGETWEYCGISVVDIGVDQIFDIFFINDSTGWAAVDPWGLSVIWRTDDSGETWVQQYERDDDADFSDIYFVNADTGFVVTNYYLPSNNVVRTVDGGITWEEIPLDTDLPNVKFIHFADERIGWTAGDNGTIYSTSDAGITWESICSGTYMDIDDIFFTDEMHGWGSGRGIIRTRDGGNNWEQLDVPFLERYHNYDIYFLDKNIGWVSGDDSTIMKTEDGGENWDIYEYTLGSYLYDLYFFDEMNGLSCGSSGTLGRTSDGGQTWESIDLNIDEYLSSFFFLDDNTGWIQAGKKVARTTDGGGSWTVSDTIPSSEYSYIYDLFFLDNLHGLAVGGRPNHYTVLEGIIWRTFDGGQTWEVQDSSSDYFNSSVHFTDDLNGWIVGYKGLYSGMGDAPPSGIVYKTDDGGYTWTEEKMPIGSLHFNNVLFVNESTGWITSKCGSILKTTTAGKPEPGDNYDQIPRDYDFIDVYPNPFNSKARIKVNLPYDSNMILSVYNIIGQRVAKITDDYFNKGQHSFSYNAYYQSSGIYFIKASVNPVIPPMRDRGTHPVKQSQVKKILLVK